MTVIQRHGAPPRGAPPSTEPSTAPAEAIALAIDSYISALTPEQFDQLVSRTRG